MTDLQRQWRNRSLLHVLLWLGVLGVVVWACWRSEFSLKMLLGSGERTTDFFSRMFPPAWEVTGDVFTATIETLTIAVAGTAFAVVISLPLGFLAASNVSNGAVASVVKTILGAIRAVPLIIVAVIFVAAVGLGPFPGMLAIAFHSTGMLAKFYAEEFETASEGIVSAIRGTGAGWMQTMRYGVFSQSVPQLVSFTVYRLEMNFRDATVLGLVGAGGIGYYIQVYAGSARYDKVLVLLLLICAVVFVLDQLTFWIRRWVR